MNTKQFDEYLKEFNGDIVAAQRAVIMDRRRKEREWKKWDEKTDWSNDFLHYVSGLGITNVLLTRTLLHPGRYQFTALYRNNGTTWYSQMELDIRSCDEAADAIWMTSYVLLSLRKKVKQNVEQIFHYRIGKDGRYEIT